MEPWQDPTVWFIPGFLALIFIELYLSHKMRMHVHNPIDSISSIGMGLGSLAIGVFVKAAAFFIFTWLNQFAIFPQLREINVMSMADNLKYWWAWLLLLFMDDFSFYWHHRLSHHIRILWAAHVNHHSSVNYNLAVALRQSWTEILYKYVFWLWLPIIGFPPLMVMIMMSFSLIYQFWVHTKTIKTLGFLEWFMNTPSHHRVHHASNVRYLDRNHAGIFIIWDRLLGTFAKEEDSEPVVYGLTTNIHTYNLFKIASHEYFSIAKDLKRSPDFITKLKYLFMPPGWSHDGSTKTSDELRKDQNLA